MKNENMSVEDLYLAPEDAEETNVTVPSEADEHEPAEFVPFEEARNTPRKLKRVEEIPEQRGTNVKVFRMNDGTEQAVFSPSAIHVFDDETHMFEDVETTLIEDEDGRHFTCGKNHFVAKFSREDDNDEIFSIEQGQHKVTVCARRNKKNRNKGVKPILHKSTKENIRVADILTFTDMETDTDYEYTVEGSGVKENIVVKNPAAIYRYLFALRCENVTAQFDECAKRIAFLSNDGGGEVFFIPAPFMTDANGITSTAVNYEMKTTENGLVHLTVTADADWMNSPERTFPVAIDPQIKLSGSASMNTYSWNNGSIFNASLHTIGMIAIDVTNANDPDLTEDTSYNAGRMYMSFAMPTLPRNPRIKKAELQVFQSSSVCRDCTCPLIGLYRVTDEICTGACTPTPDSNFIDYARMRMGHCEDGEVISYTFDITTLVDMINKNESYSPQLVLKLLDESITSQNNITLYGSSYGGIYTPKIVITYESSYGVNTSYRTHTHELGRFGQGSVDLQCGNLMFESEDFAWSGNRMPVTIKHLFNSALAGHTYTNNSAIKLATADFSAMKLGYGFKLNIMQSMVASAFIHEGTSYSGYVYVGENGEETFFKRSETQVCCNSNSQCCNLYEDVNGGDMLYNPVQRTLKQGENTYQFDAFGRLIRITDAFGNHMDINYTLNRITSVTDGAGREFRFAYNSNGQLTSIEAPDLTNIQYAYSDCLLTDISYPDGKKAVIAYSSSKPTNVTLQDANGAQVYKVAYAFSGDRLESVTEYGSDDSVGASSTYSYSVASGRTLVTTTEQKDADDGETADNVITTTYTFDDDGNIISEYVYSTDTGNVGGDGEESGINPHSGDGGAGVVSNINNLLTGHNFESLTAWSGMPANCCDICINNYAHEPYAKFGKKVLRIQSCNGDCGENGVYQVTNTLPAGQYTFSAYLRVLAAFSGTDAGAFIRVTDTDGNVLGVSERLVAYDNDYTRLIVPFELATAQSVQVQIIANGKGTIYADAAQLENNPYANAYNMLENGNFECGTSGWTCSDNVFSDSNTRFNMSKSLCMNGAVSSDRYAYQTPSVRTTRSTRETFTLSGWAKGYGLPNHDREDVTNAPRFRLRAEIKYYDTTYREYGTEEFTADFSPCTEEWQFASVQFSKSKYRTIQYIRVYCDYGYNSGTVYFDDVQLVRNSLETSLSASDFVVESTGTSDDVVEEATNTTPTFHEARDKFGNALTETTFTDGEFGTIYRAFKFNDDDDCMAGNDAGNNLVEETDALGHKTTYTVDGDTSRNEEVTDRLGNKTAYEYDASGRTTKVTSKDADNTELAHVSYAYDTFDNMTEIVRGDGMKYALAYNEFRSLEAIGIEGKDEALIKYAYKNGNGRLKEMKYANGDTMKATYNAIGQMVAETWLDQNGVETAHYKYVYDGDGNIVRSIDIFAKKEYNYQYEEGRIVRATEADIELSGEIVTSKAVVNTVKYYYDTEGKMTRKVITPASGTAQTIYYETNDDNTVVKFSAGGRTVTSHSKTDSFGRKVFDELQLGTDFVSRQFVYHAGKVTAEHKTNAKVKSSATTQLVSQIILSNGTTLSYGYDAEERITSVVETYTVDETPVTNTTLYTYDALGQLLTETVNGEVVNTMEYDNYGNITKKNGKTYTYGDTTWKDLLTGFDGKTIEYDAQGNPTTYLGHTLTWEKGRQLKRFVKSDGTVIDYTYNANGIRTSKTVGGVKHVYSLDDGNIGIESWNNNVLQTLYDNEESVCGIIYNNVPYYFLKNLQGDIVAITDNKANVVAKYTYDAWGKCTITYDCCGIASINPYRYRGYYYDNEIGIYYVIGRYYDPQMGRFLNPDDSDMLQAIDVSIGLNLITYCANDAVNITDSTGFASIKSVLSKIEGYLKTAINKFKEYLKTKLFNYNRRTHVLSVSTTVMSTLIDTVIAVVVRAVIYKGVKTAMKALLQFSSIRKSFIGAMFDFFLTNKWGKKVLWVLAQIGFAIAGKPGLIGSITSGVFQGFLEDILSTKTIILGKAVSFISAFSSVGGIIALFFDAMDRKPDGWVSIKVY